LNAPVADEEMSTEWQDLLICERDGPDRATALKLDTQKHRAMLVDALRQLTSRELSIIKSRRIAETPATLEEIGGHMGLSKERVRQIESEALKKLRMILVNSQYTEAVAASLHD